MRAVVFLLSAAMLIAPLQATSQDRASVSTKSRSAIFGIFLGTAVYPKSTGPSDKTGENLIGPMHYLVNSVRLAEVRFGLNLNFIFLFHHIDA